MASLEEATIQRRVFAWQGADTEPLTGTEADSSSHTSEYLMEDRFRIMSTTIKSTFK